jgi:hypothetical protein
MLDKYMVRIILLGAAAVALAIFAEAYASDPNLAQTVSPYAAVAPFYASSPVEGRAAYVDRSAPAAALNDAAAPGESAPVSKAR